MTDIAENVLSATWEVLHRYGIRMADKRGWLAFERDLAEAVRRACDAGADMPAGEATTAADEALLPHGVRISFSPTERRILCAVAAQIRAAGVCLLSRGEIAQEAKCRPSTVYHALRKARAAGLVTIEERYSKIEGVLPNAVRIKSQSWLDHIGSL